MSNTNQTVIQKTKNWVEKIVIDLDLCPFASQPFQNDAIEHTVCTGRALAWPSEIINHILVIYLKAAQ